MICRYCAQEIADGSQFCTKCGAPLGTSWNASAATAMPMGEPKTSTKAVISLVCGCLFFAFPVPIVAIVLGHMALSEIGKSAGRLKGEGIAILGLVLGYVGGVFLPLVLILAAIAIPNLLRARMAANESVAIASLRQYNQGASAYAKLCPNQGYPDSSVKLGPGKGDCEGANLIGPVLGSKNPMKSGYVFFYQPRTTDAEGHVTSYTVNADPFQFNQKGVRHFFTDETGVIRYAIDQPADKDSPTLDQTLNDKDDDQ